MKKSIFILIILFFAFGFNQNNNQEENLIYGTWNFYKTFSPDYTEEVDSVVAKRILGDIEFEYLKNLNIETEREIDVTCCFNRFLADTEYTFLPSKEFIIIHKKSNDTLRGTWELIKDFHNKYIELDYNEDDYARHFTLEDNLDRYRKMNIDINELKKVPFHFDKIVKDTIYSNRYLLNIPVVHLAK